MATIAAIKRKYENLQRNIDTIAADSIENTLHKMLFHNKEQLMEGTSSDNKAFRRYAWRDYAEMKHQMNPKPGFGYPDLYLTGAFHNSLKLELQGDKITMLSYDSKASDLFKRYKNIQGLTPSFQEEYVRKDLRPGFFKQIKKYLK